MLQHRQFDRRTLLRWAGTAGMLAVAAPALDGCMIADPGADADENGLVLPEGFTSRIIARAGEQIGSTQYRPFPDGAATFADAAVPGGWYLVTNHEVPAGGGGVTSIRFAPDGTITGATEILAGTSLNCAGGATPWGTWLSCEEFDAGRVWECDPTGNRPAVVHEALGRWRHEAAAVASDGRVYLTEDFGTGAFYRFTPDSVGDLSAGLLEVATGATGGGPVSWVEVPEPAATSTPCRSQVADTMRFDGGEGIATDGESVWFSTKGDNRVWHYSTTTSSVEVRYQAGRPSMLSGVDNLWFDRISGALLVAEDGDDLQVIALGLGDAATAVCRVGNHPGSEIAGPTLSPDRTRLYFSSQRGPNAIGLPLGVTYEVTGPFDSLLGSTQQ